MGKIAAIASLTFLESVRKKVFLILLFFAIVVVSSSVSLPSLDKVSQFKLTESWCLRAITFFGVLIAIFLSGTSIPDDIEEKKIFTVVTKPVARGAYLLGKLLGFSLVLVVYMIATGSLALGYLHGLHWARFDASSSLLSSSEAVEATSFSASHPVGTGAMIYRAEKGFAGTVWMRSARENVATWTFADLQPDDFPAVAEVELTIEAEGPYGTFAMEIEGTCSAPGNEEKQRVGPVRAQYNVPVVFRVDARRLLEKSDRFDVAIHQVSPQGSIGVCGGGMVLRKRPQLFGFELNFVKQLLLSFAQFYIVLTLTLLASVRLSGPVALFMGVFFYLTFSLKPFLREALPTVESTIKWQGLIEHAGHFHRDPDEISLPLLQVSQWVVQGLLLTIPDLDRFDISGALIRGFVVPMTRVAWDLGYAGLYCTAAFVVGWLLLAWRELK